MSRRVVSAKSVRTQILAAFAARFASMDTAHLVEHAHSLNPDDLSEEACLAVARTFAHCRERQHPNPDTQAFLEASYRKWLSAAGVDVTATPATAGAA